MTQVINQLLQHKQSDSDGSVSIAPQGTHHMMPTYGLVLQDARIHPQSLSPNTTMVMAQKFGIHIDPGTTTTP